MKRCFILLLLLILSFALAACGAPAEAGNDNPNSAQQTPELNGEISGEITVSCYDTMVYQSFLEEAARLFEEKYPAAKVNIEAFSAMPEIKTSEQNGMTISMVTVEDDPQGHADYISKINTALMGGTGADIFAADVLPLYKFAESGQLVDFNAFMEADPGFNRADYRANILDALTYRSGLWYVPLDYSFDYYTYDSTLLGTSAANFGAGSAFSVEQLIETAVPAFDGTARLFNMSDYAREGRGGRGGALYGRLLEEHYSTFVDMENKQAHFADGGFAQMLELLKSYVEQGYVNAGVNAQADADNIMKQAGEAPSERFFFKPKNNIMLAQHFSRDSESRMVSMSSGSLIGIEDDDEIAGIQANATGQVPFSFQHGFALNADSKNKATAWAFIKFLLSEEIQASASLSMFDLPLHNAAREQMLKLTFANFTGLQDQELNTAQQEALKQFCAAVELFSGQINTYTLRDSVIDDMIAAEARYFFDGVKSAAEVAATLQSKVELYLNE